MESEEFLVDEAGDRQGVEGVHEEFISLEVVLVETLRSEVEKGRHLPAFVVTSQHENGAREVEFERVEEQHHLHGEGTAVHVVAQEEVLCVLWRASYVEHLHHVVELSVQVANDRHGVLQAQQI